MKQIILIHCRHNRATFLILIISAPRNHLSHTKLNSSHFSSMEIRSLYMRQKSASATSSFHRIKIAFPNMARSRCFRGAVSMMMSLLCLRLADSPEVIEHVSQRQRFDLCQQVRHVFRISVYNITILC